jgi:multimeric flavodoxin WrbA
LSDKLKNAGALVLGTPVYYADTTGMVKYLILKMFRVFAATAPLKGMAALGISNAGGSGNGLVSGAKPMYHFFQIMGMRALEPVTATRFNHETTLQRCRELGAKLAVMAKERKPFDDLAERNDWYDSLPYVNLDRTGERRLLASILVAALSKDADPSIARGLARADELLAAGKHREANVEIGRVIDAGFKDFTERHA